MKIPFSKVTSTSKLFKYKKGSLTLECELKKINRESVLLKGRIFGEVFLECDRCANDFSEEVNWSLKLTLSNIIVKDLKDLDIIEFINSDIDFETILDGEVNSYKLLYHHCPECRNSDVEFNAEF